MSRSVKIDGLAKAIEQELNLYSEDAVDVVKKTTREVATSIRRDISEHAPVDRGKYRKSWMASKVAETKTSISYRIHAGKDGYRLAHLLEFGHLKRDGGRTRAFPHIKPAEQRGIREIEAKTKSGLTKIK